MTNLDTILNSALERLVAEPCDFCHESAHLGICPAMLTFVERLRIRRLCPTCGAEMERAGKNAWLCPNQRTEALGISLELRQSIREMAQQRVGNVPF